MSRFSTHPPRAIDDSWRAFVRAFYDDSCAHCHALGDTDFVVLGPAPKGVQRFWGLFPLCRGCRAVVKRGRLKSPTEDVTAAGFVAAGLVRMYFVWGMRRPLGGYVLRESSGANVTCSES